MVLGFFLVSSIDLIFVVFEIFLIKQKKDYYTLLTVIQMDYSFQIFTYIEFQKISYRVSKIKLKPL